MAVRTTKLGKGRRRGRARPGGGAQIMKPGKKRVTEQGLSTVYPKVRKMDIRKPPVAKLTPVMPRAVAGPPRRSARA